MSSSKSEFISTEDGIDVFVEHGDLGAETVDFINGIGAEIWRGDPPEGINDADTDVRGAVYRRWYNPTLRFWKKRRRPERPNVHVTKGRFRFLPPKEMCLLGPDPQYETKGEGQHAREVLKTHPACACDRCTRYSHYQYHNSEYRGAEKFWAKVSGAVKVEV